MNNQPFTPGTAITFKLTPDAPEHETQTGVVTSVGTGTLTAQLSDGSKVGLVIDHTVKRVEETTHESNAATETGQNGPIKAPMTKDSQPAQTGEIFGAMTAKEESDGARTLTRAHLVREIAQLRGWQETAPNRWLNPECTWIVGEPQLPRYFKDANAALELLEEMRANDVRCAVQTVHSRGIGLVWRCEVRDFCAVEHGDFHAAVCLAWFEWRTGQRITLSEESEANNRYE